MTKKIINVIILMITCLSINAFCYEIQAVSSVDGIMDGAEYFLNSHDIAEEGQDDNEKKVKIFNISEVKLHDTSNFIFNLLLGIAMIVAVIVGMILGIQFMTASIEEKAKVKEHLVPYVVGCIVIFGAFGIWKFVVTLLNRF